jgi:hypothetical protein
VAAVVKNLDLVVCVDTALAHCAAGLGAPVGIALPFCAEWRWLLDREDSPWYPTARLFRQGRRGDWQGVFERMAGELPRPGTALPLRLEVSPGELIDRLTILEIKTQRIGERFREELEKGRRVLAEGVVQSPALEALTAELRVVNESCWQTEGDLRGCEREQEFGPRFIELARARLQNRERRGELKRRITEVLAAPGLEE